jgi:hypothetical protein
MKRREDLENIPLGSLCSYSGCGDRFHVISRQTRSLPTQLHLLRSKHELRNSNDAVDAFQRSHTRSQTKSQIILAPRYLVSDGNQDLRHLFSPITSFGSPPLQRRRVKGFAIMTNTTPRQRCALHAPNIIGGQP